MTTGDYNIKSKSKSLNIVVSNPGKQYTHQLLYALEKQNINYLFFTSFWYKPGKFPFNIIGILPEKIQTSLVTNLRKRFFESIPSDKVVSLPYFEILRELSDKIFGQRFSERMQFRRDRLHDYLVAKKLNKSFSLVIGYEEACLHTFRKAKQLGITTILDLAQIHYKDIENISLHHPQFGVLFNNKALRNRINKIKEEELQLSDYILCLSDFAKTSLVNNGIRPEKIFVVNPGFSPEKFKYKSNYKINNKLKLIFSGTITRRKGVDLLIRLASELSEQIELTLVGPMADADDLVIQTKGITHHPYVEQEKLNQLLIESDLHVFPSYLDSWAMVVIEAMATGLPVIVSENTGSKQAVSSETGFVVPAGDYENLKEKILYFYHNRNQVEVMGKEAAKQALNYTWDKYHIKINDVLAVINKDENK